MATTRKLQLEVERCLKKVGEGVDLFETTWWRMHETQKNVSAMQKRKDGEDLKKEIRKLRRLRDQIRGYISLDEVKDKAQLTEARRAIETQMERFEGNQRTSKTKSYSVFGLNQASRSSDRDGTVEWLVGSIDSLSIQLDQFQCEMEAVKRKPNRRRLNGLLSSELAHNFHMGKLESVLRLFNNLSISVEQVGTIREDVDRYVASSQEAGFQDNAYLYDEVTEMDDEINARCFTSQGKCRDAKVPGANVAVTPSPLSRLEYKDRQICHYADTSPRPVELCGQQATYILKPDRYQHYAGSGVPHPHARKNELHIPQSAFVRGGRRNAGVGSSQPQHSLTAASLSQHSIPATSLSQHSLMAISQSQHSVPATSLSQHSPPWGSTLCDDAFPRLSVTNSGTFSPAADNVTKSWSAVLGRNVTSTPGLVSNTSVTSEPSLASNTSVTSKPLLVSNTSVTSKPLLGSNTSVTSEPTLASNTSVTSKPLLGSNTSVTSEPSLTSNTSVTSKPLLVSNTSVTSEPSLASNTSVTSETSLASNTSMTSKPLLVSNTSLTSKPLLASNNCAVIETTQANSNATVDTSDARDNTKEQLWSPIMFNEAIANNSKDLSSTDNSVACSVGHYDAIASEPVIVNGTLPRVQGDCTTTNDTGNTCSRTKEPLPQMREDLTSTRHSEPLDKYLLAFFPNYCRPDVAADGRASIKSVYHDLPPVDMSSFPKNPTPHFLQPPGWRATHIVHTPVVPTLATVQRVQPEMPHVLAAHSTSSECKRLPSSDVPWSCCPMDPAPTAETARRQLQRLNASFKQLAAADGCISWTMPPPINIDMRSAFAGYW